MIVRFIGDPCGYRLVNPPSQPPHEGDPGPQWMLAIAGPKRVWVDVAKAYLIELKD